MGKIDLNKIKDLSPEDAKKLLKEQLEENDNLKEQISESKNKAQEYTKSTAFELQNVNLEFKDLLNPLSSVVNATQQFTNAFTEGALMGDVKFLIENSQKLANNMGIGSARSGELRTMIANAVPEMVKFGMTSDEAIQVFADVPKSLKVNTTLAKDTIVELGAASQISGVNAGKLADDFKSVGFNLDQVGDKMADVANYAKGVGVNVKAVSQGVVENLKNLNTMNFEGGIKGLTKMVAQSEMLGVNMSKVLQKADELMNPESAIEFSSALQRLGVQSSALLDPLSAMDMALNDPQALQNEMVKISQQFTRLKADGSGFEILPGAKLQLKEVAKQLGMNADELANMAIKSSDLDMKMSKIRFPGFAASEEDKTLIANMSQMKDGQAVVQIKNEQTGQMDEVNVENLTAEQLETLKKDQADQNKTAEELAREQLTVLEQIAANTTAASGAVRMGIASTAPVQRMTDAAFKVQEATTRGLVGNITTEGTRRTFGEPLGQLEGALIEGGKLTPEGLSNAMTKLSELPAMLSDKFLTFLQGGLKNANTAAVESLFAIESTYAPLTGNNNVQRRTGEDSAVVGITSSLSNAGVEGLEQIKQLLTGGKTTSTSNVNVKNETKVTVSADDSMKGMVTTEVQKVLQEYMNSPTFLSQFNSAVKDVNSGDIPNKGGQ